MGLQSNTKIKDETKQIWDTDQPGMGWGHISNMLELIFKQVFNLADVYIFNFIFWHEYEGLKERHYMQQVHPIASFLHGVKSLNSSG